MLKRKEFILGAAVGLTLAAAATAGGVIEWPGAQARTQTSSASALHGGRVTPTANAQIFAPPPGAPLSFADIFDRVSPAVVQIDVRQRVTRRSLRGIPGFENFPFPFAVPQQPGGEGEEQELPQATGSGSGFFISADGYIVTNNHVVENAAEITVRLSDERELEARVVGRDPETDLAVLKVDGGDYPFVSFEASAQPRVGDWVIAVGNPFGLGGTATAGIVSARGRDIGEAYVDFIQIDAPINRGNSGGPTFDIYGRVIGVNTAIFSPNGFSVGIGFAIPADVAQTVTQQLIRDGAVERGYLGVEIITLTDEYRAALGLSDDVGGAYIGTVTPDGPAARGGLRAGDIVVGLNGQTVSSSTELTRLVGRASAGDLLRLDILRDGRRMQVSVRSGTRPSPEELRNQNRASPEADQPASPSAPAGETVEGLTVTPLTAALRERYNIPAEVNGLVVTQVERGAEAARIGFQPGVVILRADNRATTSVADFRAAVQAVRDAGRPGILLLVRVPASATQPGGNRPVVLELNAEEAKG